MDLIGKRKRLSKLARRGHHAFGITFTTIRIFMHLKDVDQLSQLLANYVFRVRKFACSIAIHHREAEEKQNDRPAIVERSHLGLCKWYDRT